MGISKHVVYEIPFFRVFKSKKNIKNCKEKREENIETPLCKLRIVLVRSFFFFFAPAIKKLMLYCKNNTSKIERKEIKRAELKKSIVKILNDSLM